MNNYAACARVPARSDDTIGVEIYGNIDYESDLKVVFLLLCAIV